MQHLGVHQTLQLGDEDALSDLRADISRLSFDKVRISLPVHCWKDEAGTRWVREVVETLQHDTDLLVAIATDVATPETLADAVRHLADILPPRAFVELLATPRPRSVWDHAATHQERLRIAFEHAVNVARRADLRLVLGLGGAACTEETLLSLARLNFIRDFEAVLVDCTDRPPDADTPAQRVERVNRLLGIPRVWLTAGLSSTAPQHGMNELARYLDATATPTERLYWHQAEKSIMTRLVRRIEPARVERWVRSGLGKRKGGERPRVLVTGGAGFIGSNLSQALLSQGAEVVVLDNLQRPGVERNLGWLEQNHPESLTFFPGDIRDRAALREALVGVDQVFHLAGQVAVTTSLAAPIEDFEINARGTVNLLEEVRRLPTPPGILFTSTNKVYGGLYDVPLREEESRWVPTDPVLADRGIDERRPLDLHSPYGCSKGAGDQYVIDYARSYGLRALVFRMSCIYGPRQFGTEDQGWLAHFILKALRGETITIYGDGKQVRDVLFVDDLVAAMTLAMRSIDTLRGRAFNMGGGPKRVLSLRELLHRIEREIGRRPQVEYADWRPGDQRYFVADTTDFERATGWKAQVSLDDGIGRLAQWLRSLVPEAPSIPATPVSAGATVTAP